MNKNWIIVVIILLIIIGIVIANRSVLVSSNSFQIFKCEFNWIFISDYAPNEEYCKSWCYQGYKSNHFRTENNTITLKCYCDVNNCK